MKRLWFSYILTLFLLIFVAGVLFWMFKPYLSGKFFLTSPLPDSLTSYLNRQVSTLNLWFPSTKNEEEFTVQKPITSARAVVIYDLTTEKFLFEKNKDDKLPMASLTKIMTAIIALENKKPDDSYVVSKNDLVGEDTMGLSEGEVLTLEDLLYGLMLPSGNDATETLASNYLGGRNEFVKAMNDKAKALGLKNTHFTNPSGLQGDGDQYTTASDLLVITRYAMENFVQFRKVVSTYEYVIPYSENHKAFYLYNETNLLTSYPGVKGVKTGYTPEAGLCLVTYLEYKGHKIIGVILGSNNRREEMKELLDYSLKSLGLSPPPHS